LPVEKLALNSVNVQATDLASGISWQTISCSMEHIYAGHRAVLQSVARLHRATF